MSTTEHILLESEVREVPALHGARKVHARIGLRSRLRRAVLQLEIIDYYYLSVRSWRSRTLLSQYVLDLRFVEAAPRLSRRIVWRSIMAAVLLTALTAVLAARLGALASRDHWAALLIAFVASGATAAVVTCLYRTHETVTLYSAYGRAKLLEFIGGLGTHRRARLFLAKLAAHTRLATRVRRRSRGEHLRDEMREHFRLKETGSLSVEEYEAAKVRILSQHPSSYGLTPM